MTAMRGGHGRRARGAIAQAVAVARTLPGGSGGSGRSIPVAPGLGGWRGWSAGVGAGVAPAARAAWLLPNSHHTTGRQAFIEITRMFMQQFE
jgi:hypothetical protein